ncbi:MAG: ABC transporter permease subunit [Anaerolineae bacterium]|jgi:ABC-type spermidine/putrescine transport system permease subunit II|nr:ABC transporter permease subunit [Anaerolineae bacterium]
MKRSGLLIKSVEAVLLVFLFFLIFGPMIGLVLWSVALKWFWPHALPQEVGLDYWAQALGFQKSLAIGAVSITEAFQTSMIIALVVVVLAMAVAVPAGYALAKYAIPFRGAILFLFLMPLAFPQQPVFVNLLVTFNRWGLTSTVHGVVLIHLMVSLVFAVWISSAAFKSIPPELEEAARSVGASKLRAFFQITLPLATPGLLASAVFVFLTSLDEFTGTFFIGLPFISTLPMLLYSSSGSNLQFASVIAIVLLIPSILFMIIIERFLRGEHIGGVGV